MKSNQWKTVLSDPVNDKHTNTKGRDTQNAAILSIFDLSEKKNHSTQPLNSSLKLSRYSA
jgi:hypothetical protein